MTKSVTFIFFLIFASEIFLFKNSLNYYYFQDDWFVLNWVVSDSFLSFFNFRTDIIYWRPLSMPLFFSLNHTLFGLNPLPAHLFVLILHLVNAVLVFLLVKQLKVSTQAAAFAAFLYATAAFHFTPLSWLSTASYVIGPTFILLTLISFLKKKNLLTLIFFVLGALSSELAFTAIPILLILEPNKNTLKRLSILILISVIYFVLRVFIFSIPSEGDYSLIANTKSLNNLFWYFLWTLNVPEKMSTIIFFSNPRGSVLAGMNFGKVLILPISIGFVFFISIVLSKIKLKTLTRGALWFLAGISPVILLPNHAFSMYLVIAAIGIFYVFAASLDKAKKFKTPMLITIAAVWLCSSFLTLSFTRDNHWVVNEQAISKAYVEEVKKTTARPSDNAIFIFRPATNEFAQAKNFVLVETEDNIKQSLNNQDAMQVIYNNNTLKSVFANHSQKADIEGLEIIDISPRLND